MFMQTVMTNYCAMQPESVIINVPAGHRVSWLRVKTQNATGNQEKIA